MTPRPGATLDVRAARLEDAPAIASVQVETWQVAYRGQIPDDHLDGLSIDGRTGAWTQILADADLPRSGAVVLEKGGEVVGFTHLGPSRDGDGAGSGEITALYVAPRLWGHGGGRLLLTAGVTSLRDAGFQRATLWVLSTNVPARRFYEHLGWRPDGAAKTDDRGSFALEEVRYAFAL